MRLKIFLSIPGAKVQYDPTSAQLSDHLEPTQVPSAGEEPERVSRKFHRHDRHWQQRLHQQLPVAISVPY